MIQKKSVHIRFLAFLLLLCMLKVAFPVGEYFHNHHTRKELCTIATGSECQHKSHFSATDTHHDCIFLQLHQYFITSAFIYFLSKIFTEVTFFFFQKNILQTVTTVFTRGPPAC